MLKENPPLVTLLYELLDQKPEMTLGEAIDAIDEMESVVAFLADRYGGDYPLAELEAT